jgi:hypothetical protein
MWNVPYLARPVDESSQAVLFSGAPEDPENSYFREDSNMSIGKLGNAVSGVVYIGPAPALVTLMAVL